MDDLTRLLHQANEADLDSLIALHKALERRLIRPVVEEFVFRPWNVPACFTCQGIRKPGKVAMAYDVDWNKTPKETWAIGAVGRRDYDGYSLWIAVRPKAWPLTEDHWIRHFGTRQEAAEALAEDWNSHE